MLTQERRNQVCFQIAMGIGESLDLKKMLSVSISRYLKELGCTMGAVLLTERDFSHQISFSVAYSIPRMFERSMGFKKLIERLSESNNIETDIISGTIEEGYYYIMGLSDIGLLVLLRSVDSGDLEDDLLQALRPLNKKLGEACRACLQNENFQRSSQRFMEMANMLPAIIIELDDEYRLSYINKSTYEIFKQIDSDYFKPTSVFDFFPEHERDNVKTLLSRSKNTGYMNSMDLWMRNSRDETFPVQVLISPILHDSKIVGYRGIGIDISEKFEHQRQQQQLMETLSERLRELDCLYGISRILSETDNTLDTIFTRAVQVIPPSFDPPEATHARILFEGKEYTSRDYTYSDEELMRSSPIVCNGTEMGEVIVIKQQEGRFDNEEINLIEAVARQFGNIAVTKLAEQERNRLYKDLMDDIDTAQSVQEYLLPPWSYINGDLVSSSVYTPSSKVGGDLYDIFQIDDHSYVVYVGDISGHGVQAALTMTAVKSIVNMLLSQSNQIPTPASILTQLNEMLSKRLFHDNYMTLLLCIIDTEKKTLRSISAGHPQGFLIDRDTRSIREFDDVGGIPLGWLGDYVYSPEEEFETVYHENETICLFTDGLFDAVSESGERIEKEGVFRLLSSSEVSMDPILTPFELKKQIIGSGYDTSTDDLTFLTLSPIPEGQRSRLYRFQIKSVFSQTMEVAQECEQIVTSRYDETRGLYTKLIINEFVNNIIEHGLHLKSDTVIQIDLELGDEVCLTIRDKGVRWDLPERSLSLEEFFEEKNQETATRGRGMQMIYAVTRSHTRRRLFDLNETVFVLN